MLSKNNRVLTLLVEQPLGLLALASLVACLDFQSGPGIQFSIGYALPVLAAGWALRVRWMIAFALGLPLLRLAMAWQWSADWPDLAAGANLVIRSAVLLLLGGIARRCRIAEQEVKVLHGLLPVCMHCKRIRDEQQEWQPIERYIRDHSEADFSHGICPECSKIYYPDFGLGDEPPAPPAHNPEGERSPARSLKSPS